MLNQESKAMQRARRAMVRASSGLVLIFLIGAAPACSSAAHRDEVAVEVLNAQTDVLDKLVTERADPKVADKINADPALKEAEEHLNLVIEMMKRSNQSVKNSI